MTFLHFGHLESKFSSDRMQTSRLAVAEESAFHDGEIAACLSGVPPNFSSITPLVVKVLIFIALARRGVQSGGMRIQNLKRELGSKRGRLFIAAIVVLIEADTYGAFLGRIGLTMSWRERLRGLLSLACFGSFLPGFTNEIDPGNAVLGSDLREAEAGASRVTSGDFLTRFMLMESVSSLALMVLPLVRFESKLRDFAKRWIPTASSQTPSCASCHTECPVLPHQANPCHHMYCYYCIASEEKPFRCYSCQTAVTSFHPSSLAHRVE